MSLLGAASSDGLITQVVQVIGALCVLAGFTAAQFGALSPQSGFYLALNLAGSAVLAVLAALDHQYGFLLLEGVWALVSAWGLLTLARGRPPPAPGH
jgi:hypothetical protein